MVIIKYKQVERIDVFETCTQWIRPGASTRNVGARTKNVYYSDKHCWTKAVQKPIVSGSSERIYYRTWGKYDQGD